MKVYLVTGTVGWYEDRAQWNVAAYRTEALAHEHASQLNDFSTSQRNAWEENRLENTHRGYRPYQSFVAGKTALDPDFRMDGNDAPEYEVEELPLLRSVPKG